MIVKEISSLYKGTYNATKNDDIWITKISIPNVKTIKCHKKTASLPTDFS